MIDGHGGHAAADYVAENLGNNIVKALENVGDEIDRLVQGIRRGYFVTDREFLSQASYHVHLKFSALCNSNISFDHFNHLLFLVFGVNYFVFLTNVSLLTKVEIDLSNFLFYFLWISEVV